MIEFHTWLSQIVGYCALISDRLAMRRAWVEKDYSGTSVTDFDELYEQIFDDLDSASFENDLPKFLPNDPGATDALRQFLSALRSADQMRNQHAELNRPRDLLRSDVWGGVEVAAQRVQTLLGQAPTGFRTPGTDDQAS